MHSVSEIEATIIALGKEPNCGLILGPDTFTVTHAELIIGLAARYHVPAIYAFRQNVKSGGLVSYGPDSFDAVRRAASYIDRILKGEKPADLPVQAPIKFEMVINAKTAKTLGLTIPQSFFLRADEVIE